MRKTYRTWILLALCGALATPVPVFGWYNGSGDTIDTSTTVPPVPMISLPDQSTLDIGTIKLAE